MYKKTTHDVSVEVEVFFLTRQVKDNEELYVWAYRVSIKNNRSEAIKIKDRNWNISDICGNFKEMRGDGVIGEQPIIDSMGSYEYMSGVPLFSPSGMMFGNYTIGVKKKNEKDEEIGEDELNIEIPAFSLDSPYQEPTIH